MTEQAKQFPVHPEHRHLLPSVPWAIMEPHRAIASRNHGQTLERLADRGGLDLTEIAAVIEDRKWHQMPTDKALGVVIAACVAEIERGNPKPEAGKQPALTFAELRERIDTLTPEQLAQPVKWWGDERGGTVLRLDVLKEDFVNFEGEGYGPWSTYANDPEYSKEDGNVMPAGTPILAVDG